MNKMETMSDLIKANIEKLKAYIPEVNADVRLLSAKSQEKIMKFMHKLYGNYNSWAANTIIKSKEENTPLSAVEKEFSGAAEHFGQPSVKVIEEGIEQADSKLRTKGFFDRKENVANTFYSCARRVADSLGNQLGAFADSLGTKQDKIAINR